MPRVMLATDAEGNALVLTIPSPTHEGDEGEREEIGAAAVDRTASVPECPEPELPSAVCGSGQADGAAQATQVAHAQVPAGAGDERQEEHGSRPGARAEEALLMGAAGTNQDTEARADTDSPACDAEFVLVTSSEAEAVGRAPDPVEVRAVQEYWVMRGFSPLVALALEECSVSPALVEPGAPRDELGVLGTAQPFFGEKSAMVASWVATAYGQRIAARVVHTTCAVTESGTACSAGGPGPGGAQRRGRSDSGRYERGNEPASQEAGVVQDGERTSQQVERDKVLVQAGLLLQMLPEAQMHKAFGFDEEEWCRVPSIRRAALVQAHLGTFSEGALRGCRLSLTRLRRWLGENFFPEAAESFKCSGGLLAWWAQEEQSKSRSKSGGLTVPNSLRNGCVFAARNLALPLEVDAPVFKNIGAAPSKTPVPALSATVAFLYHFVALGHSRVALVRLYSSGIVLSMLAALRLRDAQRASVEFKGEYIVGTCFSSKHPKRRQPVVMPFFSPSDFEGVRFAEPLRSECPKGPDYIFPAIRIPRGADILHPAATRLGHPAKSSDVIKVMRFLLTQDPLRLTTMQAARYSGHSLRHLMPTLARLFGFPKEERDELARWAPTPEGRGQRRSMSNMYAQEAECGRVLTIMRKLLGKMSDRVQKLGGAAELPSQGGWHLFDTPDSGVDLNGLTEAGAEPSSSEDESEDC